ncbi:MAG: hypothetical protein V1776_04560 [Candidatus Diapherotrites archaeon]
MTEKDHQDLLQEIERNKQDRLKFVREYANWLKKTPNAIWSKQQAKYYGGLSSKRT